MKNEAQGSREVEKKEVPVLDPEYTPTLATFESGGYFDASSKRRYPTKGKPSKIVTTNGKPVEIVPTQKYGYPNVVDMDFERALFRMIDEIAEPNEKIGADGKLQIKPHIPQPIRVPTKRWTRYAGHDGSNRRWRKYLEDHLHRCKATSMVGELVNPKTGEYAEYDVSLYSQVITKGETTPDGKEAKEHILWLSDYTIRTYTNQRFARKEDHAFYTQLASPIAKGIMPYLGTGWFASFSKGGIGYTKSYNALCGILGISCYEREGEKRIKRQLMPPFDELQAGGFVSHYEIYRRGKNAEWMIQTYPAWRWFEDVAFRTGDVTKFGTLKDKLVTKLSELGVVWREKQNAPIDEEPVDPFPNTQPLQLETTREEQPAFFPSEAEELVRLFYKLFYDAPPSVVPQKSIAQAETLIKTHGLKTAQYIVEFAHRKAPDTEYTPNVFAGILHYEPIALAVLEARKQQEEKEQVHRALDEAVEAKSVAESEKGEELLAQLSNDERETLFADATQAFLERSPTFRKDLHGAIAQGVIRANVLKRLTETRISPKTA